MSQIVKGFCQVRNKLFDVPSLNNDVINIRFYVSTDLSSKAALNTSLVSRASIFQTERHSDIAIGAEGCYKGSLDLIFDLQWDLVIA